MFFKFILIVHISAKNSGYNCVISEYKTMQFWWPFILSSDIRSLKRLDQHFRLVKIMVTWLWSLLLKPSYSYYVVFLGHFTSPDKPLNQNMGGVERIFQINKGWVEVGIVIRKTLLYLFIQEDSRVLSKYPLALVGSEMANDHAPTQSCTEHT